MNLMYAVSLETVTILFMLLYQLFYLDLLQMATVFNTEHLSVSIHII